MTNLARVDLRHISKRYPGATALDDVTLSIEPGEFFTLLGPSGCGKTTLLRRIAGFNQDPRQDSGEILFDGTCVDAVPAHQRNIGMVYQDYAIFPHKSVADNVAFGLEMRGVPKAELSARVAKALAVVQLDRLGARMPHELSGGQQQRVALARAMVINPQILLMDEPLSNLDAKLRLELRDDIRDLQRSLGITTIYVTHDQEEALVISDRVCVMQAGRVHQVASPREVYARPATLFVGSFVGAMNVLADRAVAADGAVTIGATTLPLPALAGRAQVTLGLRPEDLEVGTSSRAGAFNVVATIDKVTYAGSEAFYRMACADGTRLHAHVYRPDPDALHAVGARVVAALPVARLHAFDAGTGTRIAL
jgi:iron(III) transport system ATP-binding protein